MTTTFEHKILPVLFEIYKNPQTIKVIVIANENEASNLKNSVLSLSNGFLTKDNIAYLPGYFQSGVFKYESSKKTIAHRIGFINKLAQKQIKIVLTSVCGLNRASQTTEWLDQQKITIKAGEEIDLEMLCEELLQKVYVQVKRVEEVGEYCVRGSIIDLWTPGEEHPVRLEFFGDTVEKIKSFKVHDQKSFENLTELTILPAREFVWPSSGKMNDCVEKFNDALLQQRIIGVNRQNFLEDLKISIPFVGIDDLYYLFAGKNPSLINVIKDFSQKNKLNFSMEFFSEHKNLLNSAEEIEQLYEGASKQSSLKNTLSAKCEILFPNLKEFKNSLLHETSNNSFQELFTLPDFFTGVTHNKKERLNVRIEKLQELLASGAVSSICFACESKNTCFEFLGILSKYIDINSDILSSAQINYFDFKKFIQGDFSSYGVLKENIFFTVLKTPGHFYAQETKTLFVSEEWIRGTARVQSFEDLTSEELVEQSKINSQILLSIQFSDFVKGDYVVHIQHGIAKFGGLASIKIQDISGDFLVLEFSGQDKIYVPVSKMNLIQKYVGGGSTPQLDSLKSNTFEKRKERVKKDVEKIAKELLEHHAKRAMTLGTAFSKIDEDYLAFEDAFPYEQTPCQARTTNEIMSDMSKPKAMDRLLCGDVGFGKTEVAMRACYRAVLDGKQVAWLVPTTVLAHQHFRSLKERFENFAVNIVLFDRSVGSSAKILESIKKGEIDIIIGTHRLLSKEMTFRDLGLLVVDEEQRFGVLQKEKIKNMSYGVDVLTLTATPIPRTLQLSLVGLKDLSLLTTPPKSRLATKTFVCPFEDKTISDAIEFELARGGQVFYIHNRVHELEAVTQYLNKLVPKARVCVGHGQLSQKELETTIVDFLDGKYDILLCTTIVESGVDMPNVNTILVQNADCFGLSQLYQLRGRVGRRSTRGFAYFLASEDVFRKDTEGMKRLHILQDHQELGSGFSIASHDLEMRGSGEILGDEQSGKVSDIGLETYLQMLDDAVKNLGGSKIQTQSEVEIQIPVSAGIPENYIEDSRERLRTYRRFFGVRQESVLENLLLECEDRFGQLPHEVKNLAEIARARRLLMNFGALSLMVGDDYTECRLDPKMHRAEESNDFAEGFLKRLFDLCNHKLKHSRITADGRILLPIRKKSFVQNEQSALKELIRVLGLLAGDTNEKIQPI